MQDRVESSSRMLICPKEWSMHDDDDDLRCHNLPLDQERFLQSEWSSESLVHSFVSLAQQFPSES